VPAQIEAVKASPPAQPFLVAHRRAFVIGSRTALLMLLIAALAVLALGLVALIRGGGPEVDGWLRAVFGRVFGVVAIAIAAILGIPAGIGMAAMAGATGEDAVPAIGRTIRRILAGIALVAVATTVIATLANGTQSRLVNLGVAGLVALALLGLAGAVSFTPHRGRGVLAAVALIGVAAGTVWVALAVGA
jgi:hypothetical protein